MFTFLEYKEPRESKFKKHHDHIIQYLKKSIGDGENPLYEHQKEILLKTHAKVLNDDASAASAKLAMDAPSPAEPLVIVAPTGSGKTGIITFLPYVLKSDKVLILTPSPQITNQIFVAFKGDPQKECFFQEINVIPSNNLLEDLLEEPLQIEKPSDIYYSQKRLVMVNAQKFNRTGKMSLMHRESPIIEDVEKFFERFDTLIVDEAHRYPAPTWYTIIEAFNKPLGDAIKRIVFLTATPYKKIKNKLEFILGAQKEASRKIEAETQEGTTRSCLFREEIDHNTVYKDIVKILEDNQKLETKFKPQAMILVSLRREAVEVVSNLNNQASSERFAVYLKAGQPDILSQFKAGNFQVAVTCGVATEGFNNPNVVCCVILRRLTSEVLFEQFIGRCMRLKQGLGHPDQSKAVVLSYKKYEQEKLWNAKDTLAEHDYVETDYDSICDKPKRNESFKREVDNIAGSSKMVALKNVDSRAGQSRTVVRNDTDDKSGSSNKRSRDRVKRPVCDHNSSVRRHDPRLMRLIARNELNVTPIRSSARVAKKDSPFGVQPKRSRSSGRKK